MGKLRKRHSSDGVIAKKHLGQHFLNRPDIAQDIADLVYEAFSDIGRVKVFTPHNVCHH